MSTQPSPAPVDPELVYLFLKEKVYVLPEDRPKVEATPTPTPAEQARSTAASGVPEPVASGLKSVPVRPPAPPAPPAPPVSASAQEGPPPYALPKLPARALAVLVHNPAGELEPALATMLGKLSTATEADTNLHVTLIGDMSRYSWPQAWHPWGARLTLLLGWPAELLARHRVAEPFRVLRFGAGSLIAGPHPAELEGDRALKAQLWAAIQSAK